MVRLVPVLFAPCLVGADTAHAYRDASEPLEVRVEDLLARMTPEEMIAQTWAPYSKAAESFRSGVGQLSMTAAGDTVAGRNALQRRVLNESRLGIPASFSAEALHSGAVGGTVFPEQVTQGATWDPAIVSEIAAAVAETARAFGADTAFSPVINMWTDPRFGRLQEGFSENPSLTAAYGVAAVKGLQGEIPPANWVYFNDTKVVALGKHYAAYGAAQGGLNGAPAEITERTLREVYLKPWRAFAKAGGKAVMAAHNTVMGKPCHANPYLVNEVLRKELNFGDGTVISDCNDIPALVSFRTAKDIPQAAARAMRGGVDLDLQCGSTSAYTQLNESISSGQLDASLVRQAARRVLLQKFALGLFDKPIVDESLLPKLKNSAKHRALALRAAEEGIVLLKNEAVAGRPVLPIQANATQVTRMGLIGPNAGENGKANMLGSYFMSGVEVTSIESALTEVFAGSGVSVSFAEGAKINSGDRSGIPEAVSLATESDIAVLVLGDDSRSSSEWGDRDNLDLPGAQMPLLEAVAATGTPVVLILVTGRTATFGGPDNAVLQNVSAIFSAFRPGQMGGVALANLISGQVSPSAKLAQNWLRSVGQVGSGAAPWLQWRVGKWVANSRGVVDPDGRRYNQYNSDHGDYRSMGCGRADPLFHFGHGLSYTNFSFSNLTVQVPGRFGAPASASATVTNTGRREGTEVLQLYVEDPIMETVRPWKRLLAFQRERLEPGQSKRVTLDLSADELAFYDDDMLFRVVPGEYTLSAGGSSYDTALTAKMVLPEESAVAVV